MVGSGAKFRLGWATTGSCTELGKKDKLSVGYGCTGVVVFGPNFHKVGLGYGSLQEAGENIPAKVAKLHVGDTPCAAVSRQGSAVEGAVAGSTAAETSVAPMDVDVAAV